MSSRSYAATGGVWAGASTDLPAYGWNAEEYSAATGLVYLRARYLSVSEGVFTSRDLHLGSAANPATLNRRAYALADPVNLYDPLGLASWLSGVASRISSAASSPFARVAEAVSQAFSAATSRFQSAVGAVRSAVGGAAGYTAQVRPDWARQVAGYAEHIHAELIERYCGFAEHMGLVAPRPSAPKFCTIPDEPYSSTQLHNLLGAGAYAAQYHDLAFDINRLISRLAKQDDAAKLLKNLGIGAGIVGVGFAAVDAHGYLRDYYDAHPEMESLRRENNAAAEFDIHFLINLVAVTPGIEQDLVGFIYAVDSETGVSKADFIYDIRWFYFGGQFGW